jgi:hypothetical protein
MSFKIKIESDAKLDIQQAINWYNKQQIGLGKKFYSVLMKHIEGLKKNPHYEIRYDSVICLPLKKFPFMIHFTVDKTEKIVSVRSVFHTSLNPEKWEQHTSIK